MAKLSKAAKANKIIEIIRDDKFVSFKYVTADLAAQEHAVKFIECPTPGFDKAFQGLSRIACSVLELTDADEVVTMTSLTIRRTKSGTKSAILGFNRQLSAVDSPHAMTTPQFRIDQPSEGEQGVRQCIEGHSQDIYKMIELAQAYLDGERLQTLLPLVEHEEGDEAEDEARTKGQKLDFDAKGKAAS